MRFQIVDAACRRAPRPPRGSSRGSGRGGRRRATARPGSPPAAAYWFGIATQLIDASCMLRMRRRQAGRRHQIADADAGHGIGLREREHAEHALMSLGVGDSASTPETHVRLAPGEALVDLVAEDPQVVPLGECQQLGEHLAREHRAERIRRRVHDEHPGRGVTSASSSSMSGRKSRSGVSEYGTGTRVEHPGVHREDRVAGIGDQHLVAGREQQLHRQVQGLGGADRHPDLLDLDGDAVLGAPACRRSPRAGAGCRRSGCSSCRRDPRPRLAAAAMCGAIGTSGSPTPSEITSSSSAAIS